MTDGITLVCNDLVKVVFFSFLAALPVTFVIYVKKSLASALNEMRYLVHSLKKQSIKAGQVTLDPQSGCREK